MGRRRVQATMSSVALVLWLMYGWPLSRTRPFGRPCVPGRLSVLRRVFRWPRTMYNECCDTSDGPS